MLGVGLGPCRSFSFSEFHHHHHYSCNSHPLCNCHFNGSGALKEKNLGRLIVRAAEGYKRVPMETAGAYQLIDRQTGEKLIVWGGADDDDDDSSQQQQQRILHSESQKQNQGDAAVKSSSTTANSNKRASFGRLKVAKIKSLSKNRSSEVVTSATDSNSSAEEIAVHDTDGRNRKPSLDEGEVMESKMPYERVNYERNRGSGHRVGSTMRGWSGSTSPVRSYGAATRQPRKLVADSGFFSRKSFKQVGCTDDVIESLRHQSVLRPSHIQAISYAPVLKGKTCIIADQSGSGKTLAYLAPVIQRLRQEELQGLGKSLPRSPRAVILIPTAELASQVLDCCRSISKHGVPFRSMVATGGFRQKTQLDSLQQELDVLIATPGRFIYLLQEGFVQLTNLKSVVLDEVDILFGDEGFEQVLQSLINSAPMEAQYLFVTATLPVDIYNKLVQVFPDCEVTMGPGIHRTSTRLEEVLVDCSGDGLEKNPETAFLNKKNALLKLAEDSPVPKTIVFCNKIETCRKVENALNRSDRKGFSIKILPFHAALAQDVRLKNIKEFLTSQSKDHMFLVCTDRASRGIDFPNVDHVVLFDFPRDPSEYVRRVGRTARGAAGEGKAFVFVVGKQVSLARRIMERNQKGHPLHDVPCAYELESSVP